MSGMAIGSLVPDFPLFFPIVSYTYTHSLAGLLAFCTPVGLCAYFIFQLLVKKYLIDVSPLWYRSRLNRIRSAVYPKTISSLILLGLSVYVGAASHVLWDSFTHSDRWGTETFPSLLNQLNFAGVGLPWYKLIQYGSTLVGLPLLLIIGYVATKRIVPEDGLDQAKVKSTPVKVACVIFLLVPVVLLIMHMERLDNVGSYVGIVLKQGIAISTVVLLILSLVHFFAEKRDKH